LTGAERGSGGFGISSSESVPVVVAAPVAAAYKEGGEQIKKLSMPSEVRESIIKYSTLSAFNRIFKLNH